MAAPETNLAPTSAKGSAPGTRRASVSSSKDDGADATRSYLQTMGSIPLLTREEETEVAMRIEAGKRKARVALLTSDLFIRRLQAIADDVRSRTMAAREVLEVSDERDDDTLRRELLQRVKHIARLHSDIEDLRRRRGEAKGGSPSTARLDSRVGEKGTALLEAVEELGLRAEVLASSAAQLQRHVARVAAVSASHARRSALEAELGLSLEGLARTHEAMSAGERESERARELMARANLRLVVSIAKRYVHRGMLLLDLIQEGNIGLMTAIDKFDHRRGYKFSTYGTWWIRQAIHRAIADQGRTIRVPVHMHEMMIKVDRVTRYLVQELGYEPTNQQIAAKMDIPLERIQKVLEVVREPRHLDAPLGEDRDTSLGDLLADGRAESATNVVTGIDLANQTRAVLAVLTPREEKIVRMRFGVGERDAHTLEEIGREYGITRERVRQIEAKALRKLRQTSRRRALEEFVD